MNNIFNIKQNDTLPKLRMLLTDTDGVPLDLTGAAVLFRMQPKAGGANKVSRAGAVVSPATGGIVEYAWQAGDTDTIGKFNAEWVLTYSDGIRTVPSSSFATIVVADSLTYP